MKKNTRFLTRGAIIAALYVALTLISAAFGLHNGVIQLRLSEVLCILPIFFPEAIAGLTIGCFLSNLLTGCAFFDVIFGTMATLIGALGTYILRFLPKKFKWVCTLPPVISNALIVPFVLIYAYEVPDAFIFLVFTVGVGELLSAGVLGSLFYYLMGNKKFLKLR